ncbi:MAG: hypothetical protein PUF21_01565 [Collinsella sp.]|nr:hypothetical protein [Collinsella sp.]MDD6532704.1 hypothetical protein [Collinsella sp.]
MVLKIVKTVWPVMLAYVAIGAPLSMSPPLLRVSSAHRSFLPALFAAAVGVVAVAIKTKSMLWCCVSGIGLYIVLSLV